MTAAGALVVVGDALLDRDVHGTAERLCPDAPAPVLDEAESRSRPGGAALAAALAAGDSRAVTLITALAADAAAEELRAGLERAGVELVDLGLRGPTPEKVRFIAGERVVMRLDRGPRPAPVGSATAAARAAIGWADAVLVSDYGRGLAAEPGLREAIGGLRGRVPVVWDPHARGPAPPPGLAVVTPNETEAARVAAGYAGAGTETVAVCAQALRRLWRADAVCVTRGPRGVLLTCGPALPLALPAPAVAGGDPCGAGDRFASRLAGALADGRPLADAARAAVAAASAFVAAGGAGRALERGHGDTRRPRDDALDLAERVRSGGGTVVATGGCFDILHAGHVQALEAARRLGDCLVVLLNSDASVRSLKGPGRPLVSEAARASVLGALACVDAVMVFDAATPEAALARLRPHVWAKGGDYQGAELPEAACLAGWGGRAVILPYLDGHSTTRLIAEAAARG
jgi:rfaE bifunctional protein nucleotidyltransferase chain/domain/rfaE bifunctional protein kinase chain/domain